VENKYFYISSGKLFAIKNAFYGKHKIYLDILRKILFNIAQRKLDHNLLPLEGKSSKKKTKKEELYSKGDHKTLVPI
jgi:hypothetical protein